MAPRKNASTALAVPPSSALTSAAALSDDTPIELPVAFMGFYSKKSNRALEIKQAIPSITEGCPFVGYGIDQYKLVDAIQVMDGQRKYFSKSDGEGNVIAASETNSDETPNEMILANVLVYTSDAIIPTTTTFRGTKSRCVSDFVKGAMATTREGWVDEQGPIGKRLVELPPRLRVVGTITLQQKTSKGGFMYHLGRCKCSVLDDSQVELLIGALNDEKFNAEFLRSQAGAKGRWDYLVREFFGA